MDVFLFVYKNRFLVGLIFWQSLWKTWRQ